MKKYLILLALLAAVGAHAQTTTSSGVVTGTNAATVAPQNIGNPSIVFQASQPLAFTENRIRYDGQPVASAAPVYVNSPSPATCDGAGAAGSVQLPGFAAAASVGGQERESCNTREDVKTLRYVGASTDVIKARLCQSAAMARAFADSGNPCPAPGGVVTTSATAAPVLTRPGATVEPQDPFVRQRLGLPPL